MVSTPPEQLTSGGTPIKIEATSQKVDDSSDSSGEEDRPPVKKLKIEDSKGNIKI